MTDVKRLLAEATPLPWRRIERGGSGLADRIVGQDVLPGYPESVARADPENAALIVYAVGRLPDYEDLREMVEAMWDSVENSTGPSTPETDMEWEARWSRVSAVIDRLREDATE